MNSKYNIFFSKEITCLPSLIDRYASRYYNNALGNAITWGFFVWLIVHYIFYKFLNAILKQMRCPEYKRLRITSTLWSFGFCFGGFIYCYSSLLKNNINILTFHKKIFTKNDEDVVPGQFIVGYVVLITYYMQNSFWEFTQNNNNFVGLELLAFVMIAVLSYCNSCVEFFFVMVFISNLVQFILEVSRIFSFQLYIKTLMNVMLNLYFCIHISISICVYIFIYSLFIVVPMIKLLYVKFTVEYILLNFVLWIWIVLNIYNSVLTKLVKHYIYHQLDLGSTCQKSYMQCALFPVRTDTAFNLQQVRKEIEYYNSKSSKNYKKLSPAMGQILKCAVSFRRKVKKRRELAGQRDSSESEIIARSVLDEILNNMFEDDSSETSDNETDTDNN